MPHRVQYHATIQAPGHSKFPRTDIHKQSRSKLPRTNPYPQVHTTEPRPLAATPEIRQAGYTTVLKQFQFSAVIFFAPLDAFFLRWGIALVQYAGGAGEG
jgi:hypothetical protein